MRIRSVGALWSSVLVASLVVGFTTTSVASHYWGQWKYADAYINYYNGATGNYYTHFQEEALLDLNGWNRYTDVHLTQVGSAGTTDHINAYSGFYGNNGWLGIAEILQYSGWTVKEGRCRLNRSYLDFGYSSTNIKHVACQEVGHLFGLGHNHNSNATCMNDYILTAPQPDLHDQEIVNQKY